MRITVGIPSRGRPLELAACVYALDKTKSGSHEVAYLVGHDHDDQPTSDMVSMLSGGDLPIVSSYGPRPLGLGEIHNRLAAETPIDGIFMLWSDRIVPVTMHWDDIIAQSVMQMPHRVLWFDSHHLAGPAQFILSPLYRSILPAPPCPGIFPFWFEDTHVEEIDLLVHGSPYMRIDAMAAGPRSAKTNRMRHLDFWISLFAALRPERIYQARIIADKLGVVWGDKSEQIAILERRDRDFHARAPELTERYGGPGEPDATYLLAFERARKLMREIETMPIPEGEAA